jgi:hypothetical protein
MKMIALCRKACAQSLPNVLDTVDSAEKNQIPRLTDTMDTKLNRRPKLLRRQTRLRVKDVLAKHTKRESQLTCAKHESMLAAWPR